MVEDGSEEEPTNTPYSDASPSKATAEDRAAFAEFRRISINPKDPASSPKAPTPTNSSAPAHQPTQSLQVLATGSRFADVNTFKCLSPDMQDLDTAKQDLSDQKKICDATFTGLESLHMFKEDLQTESLARRKW
mmetsp:Transcript_2941/g.3237  ORF Transcript_2941/g.3237 Transcript_2941/m.3237 type:complete len:134 (+) Transcript_2941:339-740(+)